MISLAFKRIFSFFLFVFLASFAISARAKTDFFTPSKMAILGGGPVNVGEGAHPSYDLRPASLVSLLKSDKPSLTKTFVADFLGSISLQHPDTYKRPSLVWPSFLSFSDIFSWVYHHFILSLSRLSTDFPRLSWAYLLAIELGLDPESLLIAAQPSASVDDLEGQFKSVRELDKDNTIDTFFVLLGGADFCRAHPTRFLSPKNFGKEFLSFVDSVIDDHIATSDGKERQLVVLSYLGITQILASPGIREKSIFLPEMKEAYTCESLMSEREKILKVDLDESDSALETFSLSKIFPQDLRTFCPTIFSGDLMARDSLSFASTFDSKKRALEIKKSKETQLSHIAGYLRSYRQEMKRAIDFRKEKALQHNLKLIHVRDIEDIEFKAAHIGNDCANLSYLGQQLLAERVLKALKP